MEPKVQWEDDHYTRPKRKTLSTPHEQRILVELGVSLALLWMRGYVKARGFRRFIISPEGAELEVVRGDGGYVRPDDIDALFETLSVEKIMQTAKLD